MPHEALPRDFSKVLTTVRQRLLRLHYEANAGHIGGNLSCLDAMLVLHLATMTEADRFVLSKGHAAGALYVSLWAKGLLSEEILATFCGEGTTLPGHPSGSGVPGLLFPTGSLGHGPSLAAGLALALRHKRKTGKPENRGRVYCLCSDGEWQEGSCWETLNFALRHELDNLVILVDQNGLQGFGSTAEVIGISDLAPRFEAFGAFVQSVDGHDPESIRAALATSEHASSAIPETRFGVSETIVHGAEGSPEPYRRIPSLQAGVTQNRRPHIVVLRTRKGYGLHFEGKLESHYLPLTREQYEEGIQRIQTEGRL
jgi:transketolase